MSARSSSPFVPAKASSGVNGLGAFMGSSSSSFPRAASASGVLSIIGHTIPPPSALPSVSHSVSSTRILQGSSTSSSLFGFGFGGGGKSIADRDRRKRRRHSSMLYCGVISFLFFVVYLAVALVYRSSSQAAVSSSSSSSSSSVSSPLETKPDATDGAVGPTRSGESLARAQNNKNDEAGDQKSASFGGNANIILSSICPESASAFFRDARRLEDHRGGEKLSVIFGASEGKRDNRTNPTKLALPANSPQLEKRMNIQAADEVWKESPLVQTKRSRESRLLRIRGKKPELPIFHSLAEGRDPLFRRRRERFLTTEASADEKGGNRFFESVEEGEISVTGEGRTNAVVWGDSMPRPSYHDQQGLNPFDWPRRPIRTIVQTYSEDELLEKHHAMDIVITYVNGSDPAHRFKKLVRDFILPGLRARRGGGWYPTQAENGKAWVLNNLTNLERYLAVNEGSSSLTGAMDREHDELRYNMRSLHTNLRWHCGRLLIVSPAHIPSWLNRARNFFMTSLPQYPGGSSHPLHGKRCLNADMRRVIVVHQDAVVPMGARNTFNTNTIELYLHRIRRLSNLFIHYNDDYLTRRPTSVSTFVNRKGGPILRFEEAPVSRSRYGADNLKNGWLGGVLHTNGFIEEALGDNVVDLDYYEPTTRRRVLAEGGETPRAMGAHRRLMRTNGGAALGESDHIYAFSDMRNSPYWPRPRYFLKHAPFVYCRNMFKRHLAHYYNDRIVRVGVESKSRSHNDYVPPQLHHAFATDVPWAASAKFTPDHMTPGMRRAVDGALMAQWEREKLVCGKVPLMGDNGSTGEVDESTVIALDNNDGCAPALLQIGTPASSHVITFSDDVRKNERGLEHLAKTDPTFLTLNDNGYTRQVIEDQVVSLISSSFPYPCAAEDPNPKKRSYVAGVVGSLGAQRKVRLLPSPKGGGNPSPTPNTLLVGRKGPQIIGGERGHERVVPYVVEDAAVAVAPPQDGLDLAGAGLALPDGLVGNAQTADHDEELRLRRLAVEIEAKNRREEAIHKAAIEREQRGERMYHQASLPQGVGKGGRVDAGEEVDGVDSNDDEEDRRKLEKLEQADDVPEASGHASARRQMLEVASAVLAVSEGGHRRPSSSITNSRAHTHRRWRVEDDPFFIGVTREEREDLYRGGLQEERDGTDPANKKEIVATRGNQSGVPSEPSRPLYTVTPAVQLFYERRYKQFNQLPLIFVIDSSLPRAMQCASLRSLQLALPDYEGNVGIVLDGGRRHAGDQTSYPERCFILCREHSNNVRAVKPTEKLGEVLFEMRLDVAYSKQSAPSTSVRSSDVKSDGGDAEDWELYYPTPSPFLSSIDGIVIRIPCITTLGQTLALEDFEVRRVGESRVLYLEAPCPVREEEMTEEDLDPTSVNWVLAPTVWALMQSYPIPYRKFEPSEELLYTF